MVHFDAPVSSKPEVEHVEQNWLSRAVDGFIDSGKDALKNPGETALTVGTGLGTGALIQTGFNHAEYMGGKIGAIAKVGKVAMLVGTAGIAAFNVATAEDSARETGKMAFDTGLFLGAGKLGSFADRMPGFGKYLQPKAVSEVPRGLDFNIRGDKVDVNITERFGFYSPQQVRLSNGQGFVTRFTGTTKLVDMPKEVPGVGSLEYGKSATTLVTPNGRFSRDLDRGGITTDLANGSKASTSNGKDINISRPNGDLVSFSGDGRVYVSQGTYESGTQWNFAPSGAFSMRSTPAGKYKIDVDANDVATYTYTHGSSRSIRGMVNSSRYKPLVQDVTTEPFVRGSGQVFGRQIPDIRPVDPKIVADMLSAKSVLDKVFANVKTVA